MHFVFLLRLNIWKWGCAKHTGVPCTMSLIKIRLYSRLAIDPSHDHVSQRRLKLTSIFYSTEYLVIHELILHLSYSFPRNRVISWEMFCKTYAATFVHQKTAKNSSLHNSAQALPLTKKTKACATAVSYISHFEISYHIYNYIWII